MSYIVESISYLVFGVVAAELAVFAVRRKMGRVRGRR